MDVVGLGALALKAPASPLEEAPEEECCSHLTQAAPLGSVLCIRQFLLPQCLSLSLLAKADAALKAQLTLPHPREAPRLSQAEGIPSSAGPQAASWHWPPCAHLVTDLAVVPSV